MEQKSGKRKRGGGGRGRREKKRRERNYCGKTVTRKIKYFHVLLLAESEKPTKKKFDSRTKADAGNVSGLLAIRFAAF